MAETMEGWCCGACLDEFSWSSKPCIIRLEAEGRKEAHLACVPCLSAQFLAAQANEINYPVKWGSQTIHPRSFLGAFDRAFVKAFEDKEREYNAPAMERAYCDCGSFVAPMVSAEAKTSWRCLASSKLCPSCKARWCLRCAQRCKGFGVPHECIPERRLGERRLAFGSLKKGKDFQICPGKGCGRVIELSAACNAMECQCGITFCYVCGVQVEATSDHWQRGTGGCPRFGVVGDGHEIFDDDIANVEDDDNVATDEMVVWEQGDGESTTFNFIRWAWQAAMATTTVYGSQLDILFGFELGSIERELQVIDEVRRAMEMYNPLSRSGVSEEQWQVLVAQQNNAVEHWLAALHRFVRAGNGSAADLLGGHLLDQPRHVFNVSVESSRRAGASWVQDANEMTMSLLENPNLDFGFLGSAVFDVGPGGIPGESWFIRDMDMFNDRPGLNFYKLAGGALLVVPKDVEFNATEFPHPALPDNDQAVRDEQLREDERSRLETQARNDNAVVDVVAGERTVHAQRARRQFHPIIEAVFLLSFFDSVFIGEVNQEAYDQKHGLELRMGLQIPGSWPVDDESIYGGIITPGWYRQDVFRRRTAATIAIMLIFETCLVDWLGRRS